MVCNYYRLLFPLSSRSVTRSRDVTVHQYFVIHCESTRSDEPSNIEIHHWYRSHVHEHHAPLMPGPRRRRALRGCTPLIPGPRRRHALRGCAPLVPGRGSASSRQCKTRCTLHGASISQCSSIGRRLLL
jgi:hypothetical protein